MIRCMVARHVHSLLLSRIAIVGSLVFTSPGCGGAGEFGRQAEAQTPEQLRGLAVSYDLTKLGEEKPPVLPSPVEPRVVPPSAKPTPVTVWWQTPDGFVHQEDVDTSKSVIDRNR